MGNQGRGKKRQWKRRAVQQGRGKMEKITGGG